MASSSTSSAVYLGDLASLASSAQPGVTVHPSEDQVLTILQQRFRKDTPYARISTSNLVVVNPFKALSSSNEASAREYDERAYRDTQLPFAGTPPLQPHPFEMAAKMYLLLRRRNESQAVVFRGITGSGKTSTHRLLLDQLLRLSTHSKREIKLGEQIKAFHTLLDSFGNAKTVHSPNASRHGRYLELHFTDRGRIDAAKLLTFGLDKSRLTKLNQEERTYHVFYQLLAGATPDERDALGLEDMSDYALLASSGCYRLPAGPFSDDGIAMEDLRVALRTLGFKPKHVQGMLSVLSAILLLGNVTFTEGDHKDVAAYVANPLVLDRAGELLGVPGEELVTVLTNKTSYVRKELYTVLLDARGAAAQRDQVVRDLYAILFAYAVEHANARVAPGAQDPPPLAQIALLDMAGFQTRAPSGTNSMMGITPLISTHAQNAAEEFRINMADELVHAHALRHSFMNSVGYDAQAVADGVRLPEVATTDNTSCIELLRGLPLGEEKASRKPGGVLGVMNKAASSFRAGKSGDNRNKELVQEMGTGFGTHAAYLASTPGVPGGANATMFGINHYAGSVFYDASDFVERDTDVLDPSFVSLLRTSSDGFVARLLSGPSLATERHYKDESILVQAQVSSRPFRSPTPIISPDGSLPAGEEYVPLDPQKVYPISTQVNYTVSELLRHMSRARQWTISCIRPNDSGSPNSFDKRRVKAQLRALLLPDLISRREVEYSVHYERAALLDRYVPTMQGEEPERLRQCAQANGWVEGKDYTLGERAMWLTYEAWKTAEDVVRGIERARKSSGEVFDDELAGVRGAGGAGDDDATEYTMGDRDAFGGGGAYGSTMPVPSPGAQNPFLGPESRAGSQDTRPYGYGGMPSPQVGGGGAAYSDAGESAWDKKWDKKQEDDGDEDVPMSQLGKFNKEGQGLIVNSAPTTVEEVPTSRIRRVWLWLVWGTTWWMPSFLLAKLGRMKRPDVRLAWREKYTIVWLIFMFNCLVIFWILFFGKLLCPRMDKAWAINEVQGHTARNDYWVAIQGQVYDITDFVFGEHSDITGITSKSPDVLEGLAGQDLTAYFPPPLEQACQDLAGPGAILSKENFNPITSIAVHTSGSTAPDPTSKLHNNDWYQQRFLPKMKGMRKGPLVVEMKDIAAQAATNDSSTSQRYWAVYHNDIFDLSDYFHTLDVFQKAADKKFLNEDVTDVFQQQMGQDISKPLDAVYAKMDPKVVQQHKFCLNNAFYVGQKDFRKGAQCQAANIFMLAASIILMTSMGIKFLAALQLSPKRSPELLDKFILIQIPCYTEGEDELRRTIDSLSALKYDDKRKLLFVICDGNITGSGNERTTPRIVLDILGVDPALDPEPLLFKSIGEGSKALNYGKVYSGLYEFEGHIVPYMVVVKVGKPTERTKPGNRGKRDSQILLMHYLNRVHFDAPMNPLELEMYHQMRNVIGIDPAFYEYIFTIDADTTVTPESLNRLVASAADDQSIIGICGETRLENPEGSWWTMIQVYEYYISHHLSKAFESLFGSVTCLPGCFSMYRIRTADKGRPIIISNRIIEEYSEPIVDTLHKKNLFSLGEDRYLTTLLMKHFPTFKTKFIPDATAHTVAPESWRVLLSQRRRWINSTVHNLCELILLPELFGFCCFSMRFFVFIDLLGTLILPATTVYLVYLIVTVSTGKAAIPIISLAMIAATYGLQMLIFILKREFMLIGWMVVYIISYPVYSFFLPVYSFWYMDEFGWGNTRVVIGEGKDKKVIVPEDEKFDESMIPLKKFSEYEAEAWDNPSHAGDNRSNSPYKQPGSRAGSRAPSRAPGSRAPSPGYAQSEGGDYYRDTNKLKPQSTGGSRLKSQQSNSNMSQFGAPVLPPFGHPAQSMGYGGGSEYGGMQMPMQTGQMQMPPMAPMPYQMTGGSMYGMPGMQGMQGMQGMPMMPQHTGSAYGAAPMSMMMMGNPGMGMGMGGNFDGSQSGMDPPSMARPMSTFSMATTANLFTGPSQSTDPTEDELFNALRLYLSTQDLMTVTKKTTREAIAAKFPKADLGGRKDFLNESIDKILSQS